MTSPIISESVQKHLVENSTLLRLINKVPERAAEFSLEGQQDEGRRLTLQHEKQLATSFAFILATNDDMSQVKALGIEEAPDGMGLTLRIASNSGNILQTRAGLQKITALLEKITAKSDLSPSSSGK